MPKQLIILRGLPGSGKSYLASQISQQYPDTEICSTDSYFYVDGQYKFDPTKLGRYHQLNYERACQLMEDEVATVIIDNTNTTFKEFSKYIQVGKSRGYKITILEPQTEWKFNVQECAKRNSHGVPEAAIQRMMDRWEFVDTNLYNSL